MPLEVLVAALVAAAAVVGHVAFVGSMLLAVVAAVSVFASLTLATFMTALLSHSRLLRDDPSYLTIRRMAFEVHLSGRYSDNLSGMPKDDGLLKIGISQCLLGAEVRYDGGHKRNSVVVDLLSPVFSWVPVCPEVESGMGVPREPVALQASGSETRIVGAESGTDYTESMDRFTVRKLDDLAEVPLRGYILKSGSPSCGKQVPVEGGEQAPGLFARALANRFPALPTVEETELADPGARQNFAERVFAYDRQQKFFTSQRSVGQLVMSHAQVKLQLDAHRPGLHAEVAEVFKQAKDLSYEELGNRYLAAMMDALKVPATPAGHFAVLKTVFEAVKKAVEPAVQKELARSLQDYRQGNVPLAVPLTLLRHYVRVHQNPHFNQQTYLEPEPKELLLRTQV